MLLEEVAGLFCHSTFMPHIPTPHCCVHPGYTYPSVKILSIIGFYSWCRMSSLHSLVSPLTVHSLPLNSRPSSTVTSPMKSSQNLLRLKIIIASRRTPSVLFVYFIYPWTSTALLAFCAFGLFSASHVSYLRRGSMPDFSLCLPWKLAPYI